MFLTQRINDELDIKAAMPDRGVKYEVE